MAPQKIQKILQQTKKPPSRYQSQHRNEEKKKSNIYLDQNYRSPLSRHTANKILEHITS